MYVINTETHYVYIGSTDIGKAFTCQHRDKKCQENREKMSPLSICLLRGEWAGMKEPFPMPNKIFGSFIMIYQLDQQTTRECTELTGV